MLSINRPSQSRFLLIFSMSAFAEQTVSAKCNWLQPHTCVNSRDKKPGPPNLNPVEEIKTRANEIGSDVAASARIAQKATVLNAELRRRAVEMVAGHEAGQVIEDLTSPGTIASSAAIGTVAAGGEVLQGGDPSIILTSQLVSPLTAIFEDAIRRYQNEARPMPENWKDVLREDFSEQTLSEFRYVIDPRWKSTLPGWTGTVNYGNAVTVGNIVVFPYEPGDDWHWIGHEVYHTVQYKNLGIKGFAQRYVFNYKSLEDEADVWGDKAAKSAVQTLDGDAAGGGSANNGALAAEEPITDTDTEEPIIIIDDDPAIITDPT